MKHPTEDHSLFGIDLIDELVEECLQLDSGSEDTSDSIGDTDSFDYLGSITEEVDYDELWEVHNLFDSEDDNINLADLSQEAELLKLLDQVCKNEDPEFSNNAEVQVGETKKLFPAQVATMFTAEQHKKAIGWKLSDLPRINPSIYMHRVLMEEKARPIRQQQRRMNLNILDVVKKEVTKLLAVGIIYPISDSQWVSLVQVVPKKSRMIVMKKQHDELIQNNWRVCIDYRRLNQATHKDHFPLPFIDQVLEKLAGKSH
ncbi:hypothetical protein CR513_16878, partial [Mucuna pruriens]